jgi:hypothetical protein
MYETGNGGGALFGMMWLVWVAAYLFFGYCQYRIAQKAKHHSPWYAFIPFVNLFQLISMANKEWWWFVLFLIPIANIVAFAIVWMEVCKKIGESPAWGIAMLVPFVNMVAFIYLAFSSAPTPPPSFQAPPTRQPENIPQ